MALLFCYLAALGFMPQTLRAADQGTDALNVAMTCYNRGDFDQAVGELRAFLARYPEHAEKNQALYYLGESLVQKKRFQEAFSCYDEILGKQLAGLKITEMEKCIDEMYYKENIHPKMSQAVRERFARQALFRAGQVAYDTESFEEARKYLFAFIMEFDRDSLNEWTLQYLASIAMHNYYSEAVDKGYHPVARVFAEEAEHYFTLVTSLFPGGDKYAENLFGLAWAKNRLGKYSEAMPILNDLIANHSEGQLAERAYYELGETYFDQRNYEQAITNLTYFEKRYPRSELLDDSKKIRAKSLAGLRKYKEALVLFSQLRDLTPEDELVEIRCHFGLADYKKASQLLSELAKRPESENVRDTIRSIQAAQTAAQGDLKAAISTLEALLRAKYDPLAKEMTFAYFDPPEKRDSRRRRPDTGASGSASFPNAPFSTKGKLTEESFLMACSILCLCYNGAEEKDKSDATLRAMRNFGKSDDERHHQIVNKTMELLVDGAKLPGTGQNGSASGNGVRIPVDPGLDGGIDFGKVVVVEKDMFDPVGGAFQPPKGPIAGNYDPGRNQLPGSRPHSRPGSRSDWGKFDGTNDTNSTNGKSRADDEHRFTNPRPDRERPGFGGTAQMGTGTQTGAGNRWSDARQRHKRTLLECRRLIEDRQLRQADEKLLELLSEASVLPQVGAEAAYLRCEILLELGREDEAQIMCEYILSEFHNSVQYAKALWISAEYYEKHDRSEDALEYYDVLTQDYPNDSNADGAWFNLGWYEMTNKGYKKAKQCFRKVYTGYPDGTYWSHATWGLAYIAYMERDDEQAELLVREVLTHPPDYAILDRTLYLKGLLAVRKDDWKTAEIAFEAFLRQTDDSGSSLARSAKNYLSQARSVSDRTSTDHRRR